MKNKKLVIGLVVAVGLLVVISYFVQLNPESAMIQNDERAVRAVRMVVENFGKKLQYGPTPDEFGRNGLLESEYGPYITPALLAKWQNDPTSTPGRPSFISWPDHIDIADMKKVNDATYEVRGDIVDLIMEGGGIDESPAETARRPITLTVQKTANGQKTGGNWLISDVILSPYPGDGDWVLSAKTAQGLQFLYPEPLPTKFISAQDWPPSVETVANPFSCPEGEVTAADGPLKRIEKHEVGDRLFCVALSSEGAAGSIYRTYDYSVEQAGSVLRVLFTLRFPQCLNYDEPNQSMCRAEQESYDIDGLVDRIASSVRRN